jgi:hypothetical protein
LASQQIGAQPGAVKRCARRPPAIGADGAHQRFGEHERRIGEPVDEVGALRVRADDLERLAVGRRVPLQPRAQPGRRRTVESEQRRQRFVCPSRFHRVHGGARRVVGNQHRDAVDDRERAALAAQHAPGHPRALADQRLVVHEVEPRAAEGAAQQIDQRHLHQQVSGDGMARCSMKAGAVEPTSARR